MRLTYLYAALLTLGFVGLSVRTLRLRHRLRIAVGDGDNPAMLRAMRAHANFAEYVPIGLMMAYFAETAGAPRLLVHALGLTLLVGRALHAFGVSQVKEDFRFRVAGMALTLTTLLVSSSYLLVRAVSATGL